MNDIRDIVFKLLELNDKVQEIQNEIEKRLFKYTYLSDNNKIELDGAIKEDKDYISKIYSMLNEDNETKEESDLSKLEMIDLSPSTDNKETNEEPQIIDELAELTSSKDSTV